MLKTIPIRDVTRTCGSCTACCEGWLKGSAHGHDFWPGRSCFYLGDSRCSIYPDRPEDPCKKFKCLWLSDNTVPEWMKPNLSKVIMSYRNINNIPFVDIVEAGQKIDAKVLNWVFTQYAQDKFPNIHYQIEGGWNWMGSQAFVDAINKK